MTILNDGFANLTGLASTMDGANLGEFSVGTLGGTTLAPGNNTSFSVVFSPQATGSRSVFAHLASNESGSANPFDLTLTGTGGFPAAQFAGPFTWRTNGFTLAVNVVTNFSYRIQAATNLATVPVVWFDWTNFVATNALFVFTDSSATNSRARFYRVVSP